MRRSFDWLHALVRDHLKLDAFAGHLYLFANRRKDRLKLLYWEEGRYVIPSDEAGSAQVQITSEELGALLSGIDLSTAPRRQRYWRAEA